MKLTQENRRKLLAQGFQHLGPGWYVKLFRKGDFQLGTAYLFSEHGSICLKAAFPISEALPIALARELPRMEEIGYTLGLDDDYEDYDVGFRGRGGARRARRRARRISRRDRSLFRQRVNKAAGKLARGKVMRKLRDLKVRVLQSPLADAGLAVAAKALQAYGVPESVTKMALNTAREAGIDRAKKGGWAGMVQRATEKGAAPGTAIREGLRRQVRAARKGVRSAIPGGGARDVATSFASNTSVPQGAPIDLAEARSSPWQAAANVTAKTRRKSKLQRAYVSGCEIGESIYG